jgi:hypothetical protein
MIRIEISAAAYAALAASATRGLREVHRSPKGGFYVWLPPKTLDRLRASGRPAESLGDTIIRLAKEGAIET